VLENRAAGIDLYARQSAQAGHEIVHYLVGRLMSLIAAKTATFAKDRLTRRRQATCDPVGLERDLNQIAGVVTVGLIARRPADVVLIGDRVMESNAV
jgi:hypothetical protein